MSAAQVKPYLLRALYEWCADQHMTPHIVVQVNDETRVPVDYVKQGEIVLNISMSATHNIIMNDDWIMFSARFNGKAQEVAVPVGQVTRFYALENQFGMEFPITTAVASLPNKAVSAKSISTQPLPSTDATATTMPQNAAQSATPSTADEDATGHSEIDKSNAAKKRSSHLSIVK